MENFIELKKFEEEHDQVFIEREAEVSHYYHLRQQIETLRTQLFNFITQPKYILPFLNPGRLIKVVNKDDNFGWVNFNDQINNYDSNKLFIIE